MPKRLLDRHLRRDVVDALADSRAVAVLGARQVGKSTLVAQIASHEHPARLINLDDDATAETARADPTGFIADIDGPAAIDEIQRAPELLLAIKRRLDADQTRGQFLLTGSANILSLPTVADALPGRAARQLPDTGVGALRAGGRGDPRAAAPRGWARSILVLRDATVVSTQYGLAARKQEV